MLTTSEIIKKYNLYTKKSLGQNFLTNPELLTKIVKCSGNLVDKNILEIGTGPAGLTVAILRENPKKLITIDTDVRCTEIVENELKPNFNNLIFINGDALEIDENQLFNEKYKIIANLPYNIGTTLLFKWLENSIKNLESITLLLQKEVVDRIVAKPKTKDYGRISVMCQYLCNVKKYFDIMPTAFYPQPKVISSVVNLVPKNNVNLLIIPKLSFLCSVLFNQRRKTILNNLKNISKDAESILEKISINGRLRAEELNIDDFLKICVYF
jgi:16S rRNA (adenine1518-N6/adenine1519-N6)-dimethyltransferase